MTESGYDDSEVFSERPDGFDPNEVAQMLAGANERAKEPARPDSVEEIRSRLDGPVLTGTEPPVVTPVEANGAYQPGTERYEYALIAQGMVDAAEILRCGPQYHNHLGGPSSACSGCDAVWTIELRAEAVRATPAEVVPVVGEETDG